MTEVRDVLIRVETGMKAKLRADTGVWIESFLTTQYRTEGDLSGGAAPGLPAAEAAPSPALPTMSSAEAEMFARRYGIRPPGAPGAPPPAPAPAPLPAAEAAPVPSPEAAPPVPGAEAVPGATAVASTPASTNEISKVTVTFRAISLTKSSPSANTETAFAVLNELRNSPLFDPKETEFSGNISPDEPPGTFTFPVSIKLKRPLKL